MRIGTSIGLLLLVISFSACGKEALDVAQDVGILPSGCGSDGARLQASVDGEDYCASAQVLAIGDGTSVMITGLDLLGNTLVLQLDTLGVGEHAMTEAANGVLYMESGNSYTVAPDVSGVLSISSHDPATRTLKASFAVPVYNALNGVTKQLQGNLEVGYSTEG
jgi:hypothetical protein